MKTTRQIAEAFERANLGMDVDAHKDQKILGRLLETYRKSAPPMPRWRAITRSWPVRLAAAAVIVGIIGLFCLRSIPRRPGVIPQPPATMSVAEMLTVGQLKAAYYRGGLEALEAQCEKAAEKVNMLPTELSIEDLIVELKGT